MTVSKAHNPLTYRYALQLLTPAAILASIAGREQLELDDIGEMHDLFLDVKRSTAIVQQGGSSMMM